MRNGTVVQIGLQQEAEYLYLADPNWRELMLLQPELKRVPEQVFQDIDQWTYWGADQDYHSICYMANHHGDKGNWIATQVNGNADGRFNRFESHLWHQEQFRGMFSTLTSLKDLFMGFGLYDIDVLAMDIEGMELGVLQHHDWESHSPKYIALEIHSYDPIYDDVMQIFERLPYKLLSVTPTNIGNKYPTQEAQFIHETLL